MNIQKVGVLLAMAAVFSASKAKSETTSPDTMRDVFEKPVISAVSTGDLVYTLRPDAQMEVETLKWEIGSDGKPVQVKDTETQKYPIQVQSEGTGFAFNFNKDGKCPDFSSMAYNAERDELYFGLDTETNSVFKITNASQQGLLTQKTLKEERLRNANSDTAKLSDVTSPYLISFGDWVLAFQKDPMSLDNTPDDDNYASVYHINGIVNGNTSIQKTIWPKYHTQDKNYVYISNGKTSQKINKEKPDTVESIGSIPTVGLAVVNGNLFHAKGTDIYENGVLKKPSIYNSMIHTNTNTINHIASDGNMLFVAVENKLSNPVMSGTVNDTVIRYIQADKIIPANNGAWAIRKNQMRFYSNSQLSR